MAEKEIVSRGDLVTKLETISGLYRATQKIQRDMDRYQPEDHYERKVKLPRFPGNFRSEEERKIWVERLDHASDDALEIVEQAHRRLYAPEEPEKPKKIDFSQREDAKLIKKSENIGCFSYIAIGISAFFALGAFVGVDESTKDTLPTIWGVAAVAAIAFILLKIMQRSVKAAAKKKLAEALDAHNRQQEEIMAEYNEKWKVYENDLAAYELTLKAFLEEYAQWRKVYIASRQEEERIEEQLEKDRQAAVRKIYEEKMVPAEAALNKANDLVAEEYLPVLSVIIDLLKSGRADDFKEAINLYEEIAYRERQLQLQREQEAQRRREEELRRRDAERRHQEEMEFLQDQENQRRYEEQQRQQDAERRHREEMNQREQQERNRQNEERRRAEEERRRAGREEANRRQQEDRDTRRQCNTCAQSERCSMAFSRPNCASYRPR